MGVVSQQSKLLVLRRLGATTILLSLDQKRSGLERPNGLWGRGLKNNMRTILRRSS